MIILRGYKFVVSSVILTTFISLHCFTCIRCSEDNAKGIENQNEIINKNDIDAIINEIENKHTWTIFKIIITPCDGGQNIDDLEIENIVSEEYSNNENNENNEANALLLNEEEAQKVKETMEIKNNENININNNENDKNNNKDNNENTYYVLVRDITTKKNEDDTYRPLFKKLEENAQQNKFTYTIEIIDANTTEVTVMSGMFRGCESLTKIVGLDKWKTGKVTNMSGMFFECKNLTAIEGLENFDTSNVTDMSCMFTECSPLKEIKFGDKWNTGKVTNMNGMFYGCSSLESINLSGWDTGSVTNMSFIFARCEKLTEIIGLDNWNIDNVKDMIFMFRFCAKIKNIPNKFKEKS